MKRVAPMQAFVFNQRRKQFQDPRVRRAFGLAFNFEEANKKLFYNPTCASAATSTTPSSPPTGLPQGRELELLNEVKERGSARGVHHRVEEPGQRRTRLLPQPHARSLQAAGRCGLEAAGGRGRGSELRHVLLDHAVGRPVVGAEGEPAPQRQGRDARRRVPDSIAGVREDRAALRAGSAEARHQGVDPRRRRRRSTSGARTRATTTSSSTTSPSRNRPATSSATSGARPPPTATARATPPASRTRRSTS